MCTGTLSLWRARWAAMCTTADYQGQAFMSVLALSYTRILVWFLHCFLGAKAKLVQHFYGPAHASLYLCGLCIWQMRKERQALRDLKVFGDYLESWQQAHESANISYPIICICSNMLVIATCSSWDIQTMRGSSQVVFSGAVSGDAWLRTALLCVAGVQGKLLNARIKQERELLRSCEAGSKRARVNALPADTET